MVSYYLLKKCKNCVTKGEFEVLRGTVRRMYRRKKDVVGLYWLLDQKTNVTRKIWDLVWQVFSPYNLFKIQIHT